MAKFAWPLIAVLTTLCLALAIGSGSAGASGNFGPSACKLIHDSGVLEEALGGHPPATDEGGDFCSIGACWAQVTDPQDPNQKICHYGRGIALFLEIAPTAKRARRIVINNLRRGGFVRLRNEGKADVMIASVTSSRKVLVIFAVGDRIATLSLGATSDDDPGASWDDAYAPAGRGARKIAKVLRGHPACPDVCPG